MLLHNQIKKLPRDSIISPKQLDSGIEKLKVVFLVRLQKILFVASTRSMPNRSPLPDQASSSAVGGRFLGGGLAPFLFPFHGSYHASLTFDILVHREDDLSVLLVISRYSTFWPGFLSVGPFPKPYRWRCTSLNLANHVLFSHRSKEPQTARSQHCRSSS